MGDGGGLTLGFWAMWQKNEKLIKLLEEYGGKLITFDAKDMKEEVERM